MENNEILDILITTAANGNGEKAIRRLMYYLVLMIAYHKKTVYGMNSVLLDVLLPYEVRMFYAIFGIPGLNIFFRQGGSIFRIDID